MLAKALNNASGSCLADRLIGFCFDPGVDYGIMQFTLLHATFPRWHSGIANRAAASQFQCLGFNPHL